MASGDALYVASPSAEVLTERNTWGAETGGGSLGLLVCSMPVMLSAEAVGRLLGISENAEWEVMNHGIYLGV